MLISIAIPTFARTSKLVECLNRILKIKRASTPIMVHVDAGDFDTARLLEDGGFLLFYDSTDKHVAKVIQFIRTNCRGFLKEMDLGKLLNLDFGRLLKYRVAHFLNNNQLTAFQLCGNPTRPWNVKFTDF